MCSSWVKVADSPVDPQGTSPCTPPAICSSTSRSRAAKSISPPRNGVTSAVRQPLHMSHLDCAVEDVDRVARHAYVVIRLPVDFEHAARQRHLHASSGAPGTCGGDGRGTRAGPARERLAGATLPDAHLERITPRDPDE